MARAAPGRPGPGQNGPPYTGTFNPGIGICHSGTENAKKNTLSKSGPARQIRHFQPGPARTGSIESIFWARKKSQMDPKIPKECFPVQKSHFQRRYHFLARPTGLFGAPEPGPPYISLHGRFLRNGKRAYKIGVLVNRWSRARALRYLCVPSRASLWYLWRVSMMWCVQIRDPSPNSFVQTETV